MKPVDQTLFGEGRGNCLPACIASVLELPLEAVPHFVLEDDWVGALQTFLEGLICGQYQWMLLPPGMKDSSRAVITSSVARLQEMIAFGTVS